MHSLRPHPPSIHPYHPIFPVHPIFAPSPTLAMFFLRAVLLLRTSISFCFQLKQNPPIMTMYFSHHFDFFFCARIEQLMVLGPSHLLCDSYCCPAK
ncbi:hypothetical protein BDV98DRAFT_8531 [Pterulicium gracile]|uniref:Uncharacterized protein n=1 Tax=Pterulicium gracile TaxID=1884261 RepID=A0A5C3QYJ4_9AGAR|nr:hypothetical protein BDV98DRAFT_8531 [Pterula gracilis]